MSEDLIKRSDAIEAITYSHLDNLTREERIAHINALPSADRPQGHYIKGQNGEYYCSNCKRIDDKYSVARFCWWCGADMRKKGADDE